MGPQRLHALQQNCATVDRATYNRPAGGKLNKLYFKIILKKFSYNLINFPKLGGTTAN
jgi:hypothetical protein